MTPSEQAQNNFIYNTMEAGYNTIGTNEIWRHKRIVAVTCENLYSAARL